MKTSRLCRVAVVASCVVSSAGAQRTPLQDGATARATGDWRSYNGSLDGARYSPLTELTPRTVGHMRRLCTFDTGERTNMQTGPVAVHGTLYVTTDTMTYAIDGGTCALRWRHVRADRVRAVHAVNRGVVYVDAPSGPRVVRGSGDAHAYALDARTGALLWDIAVGDPTSGEGETISAAPVEWHGLVVIGTAGGDYPGVTGHVVALDADDGHVVWGFGVVPMGGVGAESWPDPVPNYPRTGGGTWSSYTVDTVAQVVVLATGNPAPLFTPAFHAGENLYTGSVVILDMATGSLLRAVTLVPHDTHDWDLAAAPMVLSTAGGASLIVEAGKDGYLTAINRPRGALRYRIATTTIEGAAAPITPAGTRFCPGTLGGTDWNGPAYDRAHNTLVVGAVDWCTTVRRRPLDAVRGVRGMPWSAHTDSAHPFGVMDPRSHAHGWLTAVDADSGTIRWRYRSPTPLIAGVTATAGGLILTADLRGTVLALDAAAGTVLYRGHTDQPTGGGVITYVAHHHQRIAVASGMTSARWHTASPSATVVVFGLP